MGWGDVLVHLPSGPKFRKHRKIIQDRFSPRELEKYTALHRQETYKTLLDIGNSPDDIPKHMKRQALPMGTLLGFLDSSWRLRRFGTERVFSQTQRS